MQYEIEVLRRLERQYVREQVSSLDLQPPAGLILHLLDQCGPLRQEDLAIRMELDKGQVARLAAQLEEGGLITRPVSPSCRREKLVTLTPQGQALAARIRQMLDRWSEICYRGFTPEERTTHQALLQRIMTNAVQFKRGEGRRYG